MAELADAPDLGSGAREGMEVRVLSPTPRAEFAGWTEIARRGYGKSIIDLDGGFDVRRVAAFLVLAALVCLAAAGWLAHSLFAPSTPLAAYAVEASQPKSAVGIGGWVINPSPVAIPFAAAPAAASSAPAQDIRPGMFIPPIGGTVVQLFGPTAFTLEPALTYRGVHYAHFHTGIDIDAPAGTPVGASAGGVVVQVGVSDGRFAGYGNYVLIEHPQGYATLYGHLDRVVVVVGQSVRQMQLIGYVGSTGLSTGPHLHFEIRRYGDFLDPIPYLLRKTTPNW